MQRSFEASFKNKLGSTSGVVRRTVADGFVRLWEAASHHHSLHPSSFRCLPSRVCRPSPRRRPITSALYALLVAQAFARWRTC